MSNLIKIKETLKELSTLTENEIRTFKKGDVKCSCCDIDIKICTPKNGKNYFRTYPGEENNHKSYCCFFKEKYPNKLGSFKNAIVKGKSSKIHSILTDISKNIKQVDIIDLHSIPIGEISVSKNYFYARIHKIVIEKDYIYINFIPRSLINNEKYYMDLLLNKNFFEENNIKLEDAKKVFEHLSMQDIQECLSYGLLEFKNKNNGLNIKPIHVLDFLIDGLGIDELIIKNNIHLKETPQGYIPPIQDIPQGKCPF